MTSSITSLRTNASSWAARTPAVSELHLFGSALRTDHPSDVDLLVVYDVDQIAPPKAQSLRLGLRDAVGEGHKLDIMLLTEGESEQTAFAAEVGAEQLYPIE